MAALLGPLSAAGQKLGDVNRDGNVDICDAILVLNHVQGIGRLSTNQLALPLADLDTNGTIDIADFQRVIDTILGRRAVQDFDLSLLAYDDGDGLPFLEEYAAGTNPYLWDTDGDGLNDEVNVHSDGMVILGQPPLEIYRASGAGSGTSILLAQPPVEVYRPSVESGKSGVILAEPPIEIVRPDLMGGAGTLLAEPPFEIFRPGFGQNFLGIILGKPPIEVVRPGGTSSGVVLAQPPVGIQRE